MKKATLLITSILAITSLFGQKKKDVGTTVVIPCSDFHVTRPLSEIFANNPVDETLLKKGESEDKENRKPQKFIKHGDNDPVYGNDPTSLQKEMGTIPTKAPIANFTGQAASGFRPMDPSGAVGLNHYIQMINSTTFKVFNKTTGANMLTGTFGNLWTPASGDAGDPIVLYDKAADRWFMSQFGNNNNNIYIAISKTADPLGQWYTYTFTSPAFPDYLKFSVWQDGYYMTSNQAQKVFAFERTAMLAGTATSRSIYKTFSPPQSGFFVPLPGDTGDGTMAPVGTPCPIFSYSDNGWGGTNVDAINIYKMAVVWGTAPATPTATITSAGTIPTQAFDGSYDAGWLDVAQPGTTQKIDGIGGTLMYRAQWKSFTGYNTVVLNWAVKISATQRSIKWCELRQNPTTGVWSMYQEGIYTPDGATRWLGSIAMDNNGAIGLAYLKSDATSIYPSLCYTGRRSCDPLGTLPITEVVAKAGLGSQTGANRVGDYSQTTLDPSDGITFWHTGEYMSTGGVAKTQIYSFQLATCATTASVAIAQTIGTNPSCAGASNTFTATPTNGGTNPSYQWQVNGSNIGTGGATFTTTSLTNGQIVTCIMTSNLVGVVGSPATSTGITMTIGTLTPTIAIAGNNTICAGAAATFTATITNGGNAPSYQWKVGGVNAGTNSATFSSSSLTNGQVVTCVLTSNATCLSATTATSNSITMVVTAASTLPLVENFEAATFPPTGWVVNNADTPSATWGTAGNKGFERRAAAGNTNSISGSAGINCFDYSGAGQIDNLIVKPVSLSGVVSSTMTFKVAYKYYNNVANYDTLKVFVSTDCGSTYGTAVYSKNGKTLATNGTLNTTFTPAVTADWRTETVNLNAYVGQNIIVKFEVTNNYGNNIYIDDVNITGVASSIASVAIAETTGTNPTCAGSSVTFTATPTNGGTSPSYQWKIGTTNVGTNSPTFSTTTLTTGQIVTCQMTSNLPGVTGSPATSNSITMTVTPSVSPTIVVNETSGTNPLCAGASVTFTATPTNGGTNPSYQWKVGGSNVGTNSTTFTTNTITTGQIITCVLTSNATCANPATATSAGTTMTVNTIPATPTITQNGSVLTSSAASGNQWYFNGVAIPGENNQSITITQNGDYTVDETTNGCTTSLSAATTILNVGINQLNGSLGFSIYPNPSDGIFNISFYANSKSDYKVELINSLGQLIFKELLSNYSGQYSKRINISEYGKGIYTISLMNTNNENQNIKKIIVY